VNANLPSFGHFLIIDCQPLALTSGHWYTSNEFAEFDQKGRNNLDKTERLC
jgi:hypothetical protein